MKSAISCERDGTARFLAILGIVFGIFVLGAFGVGLHGGLPLPVDRHGIPLGRDFVNTWFYGRAFFDGHPGRFYDRTVYMNAVAQQFPQDASVRLWSYPPPLLMLAAPFGQMPYVVALAAWSAFGLIALGLVVRRVGSAWLTAAVLTSPVAIYSLIAGQISLLVAAVLLTAFAQLDRRPRLAGLLLSLLVIKPQAAVLLPVLLIASRRWAVLAWAALGTLAIVALSVALNGLSTWTQFIEIGLPSQVAEMKDTIAVLAPLSMTVTTAAVLAGLSSAAVSCLQFAATGLAVALVAWVGWRGKSRGMTTDYECLVVLTCSIFATPYVLIHDLAAFSAALIVVAYRQELIKTRVLLALVLYAPMLEGALCNLGLPILPLAVIAFAIWLVTRRGTTDHQPAPATSAPAWASIQTAG